MKAFFRYGLVVSCGSLVMLTSLWASEERASQASQSESIQQQAFERIGNVRVPAGVLAEEVLSALQEQYASMNSELKYHQERIETLEKENDKHVKERNIYLPRIDELRRFEKCLKDASYVEKSDELSFHDILLIHHFTGEIARLQSQLNNARSEVDSARKAVGVMKKEILSKRVPFTTFDARQKLDRLQEQVRHLRFDLDSERAKNEKQKQENEDLRNEFCQLRDLTQLQKNS